MKVKDLVLGLLTKKVLTHTVVITYTADSYGTSVTYALIEGASSTDVTYWGLNGYWTPSESGSMPSMLRNG